MDHPRSYSMGANPWHYVGGRRPARSHLCRRALHLRRTALDGRSARSGMGGPKLYGHDVVNVWAGRSDGTPPFTLIRGVPSIQEATVLTNGGKTVHVTLSPEIEEFGLRFGAAALAEDDPPETLSVRLGDGRVLQGEVPWPRLPPFP